MPNDNLTAALEGSLEIIIQNPDSPLAEATPDSVDELLDRINGHLAEGLPGKISDSDLLAVIRVYRAQALKWQQDEQTKKTKTPRSAKKIAEAINIDL